MRVLFRSKPGKPGTVRAPRAPGDRLAPQCAAGMEPARHAYLCARRCRTRNPETNSPSGANAGSDPGRHAKPALPRVPKRHGRPDAVPGPGDRQFLELARTDVPVRAAGLAGGDRKSTRLNSSP